MPKTIKRVHLSPTYDDMDNQKTLQNRLKDAVCKGDTEVVKELINLGVDVNTPNSLSHWTPLHYACDRGHFDVVALLLRNGADANVLNNAKETPADMCHDPRILQLLEQVSNDLNIHNAIVKYFKNNFIHGPIDTGFSKIKHHELVLKIRVADAPDPDFIEIELLQSNLTYQALVQTCCQELNIDPNQIVKIRKLPNTKLRRDEDIQRLQNFQEIEVVINSLNAYKYMLNTNGIPSNVPATPANGYQSISKKDQTILY